MRKFFRAISQHLTKRWIGSGVSGVRSAGFFLSLFLALHAFQLTTAPHHEFVHFAKTNTSASTWAESGVDCDECLFSHTVLTPVTIRDSVREFLGEFELLSVLPVKRVDLKSVFSNIQTRGPPALLPA
jgi:hypothetical protein